MPGTSVPEFPHRVQSRNGQDPEKCTSVPAAAIGNMSVQVRTCVTSSRPGVTARASLPRPLPCRHAARVVPAIPQSPAASRRSCHVPPRRIRLLGLSGWPKGQRLPTGRLPCPRAPRRRTSTGDLRAMPPEFERAPTSPRRGVRWFRRTALLLQRHGLEAGLS